MDGTLFAAVVFGFCSFLFHIWSLTVLCRFNNIRKNRFLCLVLNLSLSDAAASAEIIVFAILLSLGINECVFYHIVTGTLTFSLFQTFQICLYQLNATFVRKKRILQILTSKISSILGFVFTHVLTLAVYFVNVTFTSHTLEPDCTINLIFYYSIDIPIVALLFSISFITCVNIVRIKRRIENNQEHMTEREKQKASKKRARIRQNMVTLSMVIMVTLIAYTPVEVYVLLYQIGFLVVSDETIMDYATVTVLVLLNPLLDPVIYLIRMKIVRDKLRKICLGKCPATVSENQITPIDNKEQHQVPSINNAPLCVIEHAMAGLPNDV